MSDANLGPQFEDVTFEHQHLGGPWDEHRIWANRTGASPDQDYVGFLKWSDRAKKISNVHVEPTDQRRGIATAMWRQAKEITPDLQHEKATYQTDEGAAWARKVGR